MVYPYPRPRESGDITPRHVRAPAHTAWNRAKLRDGLTAAGDYERLSRHDRVDDLGVVVA